MERTTRTVRECEERLEEIQEYLGRLATMLESGEKAKDREESASHPEAPTRKPDPLPAPEETDARLDALKARVERFEERLRESGRKHRETSVELHGIMNDAQTLLKSAGVALMLVGLGGALALCCSALDESDVDEWIEEATDTFSQEQNK